MKKLMRRAATTGVSAAIVTGALLSAGGTAVAVPSQAPAHTTARTPVSGAVHRFSPHHGAAAHHRAAHRRTDPWVAGQLAWFEPSAARRAAVYDPWVKDQIALFAPATR
ncbi:hypothetical protein ACF061_13330 [Streptomyces sp. NPDC015220]|uniref:hypothetical protein n=1 Tax=Streptomyces sp. NPDC015220 TaxID=3364947 RepID=UPI0036FBA620